MREWDVRQKRGAKKVKYYGWTKTLLCTLASSVCIELISQYQLIKQIPLVLWNCQSNIIKWFLYIPTCVPNGSCHSCGEVSLILMHSYYQWMIMDFRIGSKHALKHSPINLWYSLKNGPMTEHKMAGGKDKNKFYILDESFKRNIMNRN